MRIAEYLEEVVSFNITQRHIDNIIKQIKPGDGIKKIFSLLKQNNVISNSYNLERNINNLKTLINITSKPKVNKIEKAVSEAKKGADTEYEAWEILEKASKKILGFYLDILPAGGKAQFQKAMGGFAGTKIRGKSYKGAVPFLKAGFYKPLEDKLKNLLTEKGQDALIKHDLIIDDARISKKAKIEVKHYNTELWADAIKIGDKVAETVTDVELKNYNKAVTEFYNKHHEEIITAYRKSKSKIYLLVTLKSKKDAQIYKPNDYILYVKLGTYEGAKRIQILIKDMSNPITPTEFIEFLINKFFIISEDKIYDLDKLLKGFIV